VGGVGTVRLRWGSGSLVGRLGRRPWWLCESMLRLLRVWRILGAAKHAKHLCVLFLAKIINKKSFLYCGGGEKFIKDV